MTEERQMQYEDGEWSRTVEVVPDTPRPDALIADARRDISDADRCVALSVTPATHQLHRRLREVTNALEAATGGQHVDAKHWAEVTRLRAQVEQLKADARTAFDDRDAALERLGQLSRLHEVATERTVALAAVIADARHLASRGDRDDRVYEILNAAADGDTDAALREVREKAWEEGNAVHYRPSSGPNPRNPYREETTRG